MDVSTTYTMECVQLKYYSFINSEWNKQTCVFESTCAWVMQAFPRLQAREHEAA